jgi:hypothetical protein
VGTVGVSTDGHGRAALAADPSRGMAGPVLVSLQERLGACAEQSRRKRGIGQVVLGCLREPGELVAGWKPPGGRVEVLDPPA